MPKPSKRSTAAVGVADHAGWATVYAKAQKGAADALKAVGDDGNAEANPVCKAILASIGPGKSGAELRDRFEGAPYGWSRDAVDGGLQVLLVAGGVRAQDDFGRPIKAQELERKAIGKAFFKVESVIITAAQRIQIRKLFQKAGVQAAPNEEAQAVALVLQKLSDLADSAGGDGAATPSAPTTTVPAGGATGPADAATGEPIDVREQFEPLAAFATGLRTGGDGTVTVEVPLPDTATRYRVMAVAVDGADRFGKGESAITAQLRLWRVVG